MSTRETHEYTSGRCWGRHYTIDGKSDGAQISFEVTIDGRISKESMQAVTNELDNLTSKWANSLPGVQMEDR